VLARDVARAAHAAAHLDHRVDEGAAAEGRVCEPLGHRVGQHLQRLAAADALLRAEPAERIDEPCHPQAVAVIEEGPHQVVLRRVVPVEGDLGDARRGDDAVDAGGADAVGVEEVVRGAQDALARRQFGDGRDVHGAIVGM